MKFEPPYSDKISPIWKQSTSESFSALSMLQSMNLHLSAGVVKNTN